MDDLLLESFTSFLSDHAGPEAARAAERGGNTDRAEAALYESGFLDALVPEAEGGAGLSCADILPLLLAAGEHLLAFPLAETMVARALLAASGLQAPPDRPILLWPTAAGGVLRSALPPACSGAPLALLQRGDILSLVPTRPLDRDRDPFRLPVAEIDSAGQPLLSFRLPGVNLLLWAAGITAALMAGAMARLLAMSVTHVNERQQFGRALAKFQAVQQQVSVMAERAVAARMAAMGGLAVSPATLRPDPLRVAIAKVVTGEAASICMAVGHAVHGAIGMSEEHDFGLYTRRLKRWQLCFGSHSFWSGQIGVARLASQAATSVDFVRAAGSD